jgi:PAS domain S-box-containing protein
MGSGENTTTVAGSAERPVREDCRYRALLDNLPVGIFRALPDGAIVEANRTILDMFGFASLAEANEANPIKSHLEPQEGPPWDDPGDEVRGITTEVRSAGGDRIVVRVAARAVRDAAGALRWYDGVAEDVTDELRARDALVEAEGRFRVLADDVDLLVWVSDESDACTYVNRGWLELTGTTLDDCLGDGWKRHIDPHDLVHMEEVYEHARRSGEPFTQRYRARAADGGWRQLIERGVPRVTPDGVFLGFVGTCVDVTDALRAERERAAALALLDSTLDAAPIPVGFVDRDLRHVRVNAALAACLGSTQERLVGRRLQETLGEDAERIVPLYRSVLETGRALVAHDVLRRTADGSRRFHASLYPVRVGEGVDGVGLVAVDLTERDRLERQLVDAQRLEAVGRLAGGVAHDFNNLLTVITGYSELLLASLAEDDPRRGDAAEIRDAAARGSALTRQLLAVGRRQVFSPALLDVNGLVLGLTQMLRRVIGEDVELVVALGQEPALVYADPGQLEQVLLNLAVNARDAMPEGGRLTIAVSRVEDSVDGSFVAIEVSDTGEGMDEETRARVFEPFFTTKLAGKGSGLGLATAHGIVQQSGGCVSVASAQGQGTTFTVMLPRMTGDVTAPQGGERSETVLVVEDEPLVRDFARTVLETHGFRVLVAENGPSALAACAAEPVALVLTDMVMPGMTGADLAAAVEETHPGTAVVLMSGYSHEVLAGRVPSERVSGMLVKPFTPQQLVARVGSALAERASNTPAEPVSRAAGR